MIHKNLQSSWADRPLARTGLATTALVALAMLGASGTPASAETTFVSVPHSALKVLDPIFTTAYLSRDHGYMIYDTLVATDSKGKISGQMAESWKRAADGLSWEFTLREGLNFHDGTPVRPQDVIASIKRWGSKDSFGQALMDAVTGMEVLDSRRFRINLSEPFGLVLEALGKPSSNVPFIMKESMASLPASVQVTEQIGSGPFMWQADLFRPGDSATYLRNPDYKPVSGKTDWGSGAKTVHVDRVEWRTMPDHQTAINALIAGEVDFIETVPNDLRPILEAEEDVVVSIRNNLGFQSIIRPNHLHPPFNNKKIRQALRDAISQKPILQALAGSEEYFQTCPSMFGCGTPLETASGAPASLTDGAKAKMAMKMVMESGYDKAMPIVLMHPTDVASLSQQPIVVAQQMREAGFVVDAQTMDWQSLVGRRSKKDPIASGSPGWNMFITNWAIPDVFSPMVNQMVSAKGGDAWFGWPNVPEVEALRKKFSQATTLGEQQKLAAGIQKLAYEEVLYIPLGQFFTLAGWRKSVTGVVTGPLMVYWNMRK